MEKILAGSHVYHKPTGENWVVALDEIDGRIYYMGYPFGGYGDKEDVTLTREPSPEKRHSTLQEVMRSRNSSMVNRAVSQLLSTDKEYLKGKSKETLAEWWCILNRWDWPDDLPNEEAVTYPLKDCKTPRRDALMEEISNLVDHKLISWTSNKKRMTKEKHDAWYEKTYGGKGRTSINGQDKL